MRALPALILLFALGVSGTARADSSPAAVTGGVASPDGNRVVRVVPGESIGDTFGFAGARARR